MGTNLSRRTLLTASLAALPVGTARTQAGADSSRDSTGGDAPDWNQWKLLYGQPAVNWNAALPIGNGRLGAMVFGGVPDEVLQLNEDTLWSGFPRDTGNPKALAALPAVRDLLFRGNYVEATEAAKAIQGPFSQSYLPLGYLRLKQESLQRYEDYQHELDLDAAIVRSRYRAGRVRYQREYFVSAPAQLLLARIEAEQGGWSGIISLDSLLRVNTDALVTQASDGPRYLVRMQGKAPSHVEPSYRGAHPDPVKYSDQEGEGMRFAAVATIRHEGGVLYSTGSGIGVAGARSLTILLSAATGFRDPFQPPDKDAETVLRECMQTLANSADTSLDDLRSAHLASHRGLFRRVYFDLGSTSASKQPTDRRVLDYGIQPDTHLAALYFHFGRYLLISSSRPDTQPANLQGIWNDMVRAPWSSNYTTNINAEMNYWPAEVTNLSECHEPLLQMVEELAQSGRATARDYYGLDGWVCHHNSDLWRLSNPVGDYGQGSPVWALWPLGGAWLCEHLWERFRFGNDLDYLRDRAYPVMRGAAEFLLGWLVPGPDGMLTTAPSTSPENVFLDAQGRPAEVATGCAMDLLLIQSLFEHVIESTRLLGKDTGFANRLNDALRRMVKPRIGSDGQLLEWNEEFQEANPGHRHISHLIGLHPANVVSAKRSPELYAASRRTLERRLAAGSGHTGWSRAWILNFWARLRDGAKVEENLDALLAKSTLTNLFDNHPPFQIDGNFGATAAITEALLQSQEGELDLLPALPPSWSNGRITGLRARGAVTVDLQWSGGQLDAVTLRADNAAAVRVRPPARRRLHSIRSLGDKVQEPLPGLEDGVYVVELQPETVTELLFADAG